MLNFTKASDNDSRNEGLDLLRSFAIISVLLLHSTQINPSIPENLNSIFLFGWIGVDLFFVLSGFLIGKQTFKEDFETKTVAKKLKIFWTKRWFRTFPLYFCVLATYLFIKPLITNSEFKNTIWPFLIFAQNYFPLTDFIQSWSLCIEEQFYILLPLVVYLMNKKIVRHPFFWITLIVISIINRLYFSSHLKIDSSEFEIDHIIRFPFYTHFDGLCAGVLLATTYKKWSQWPLASYTMSSFAGLTLLILTCFSMGSKLTSSNVNLYFSLLPISFSLLLIGCYKVKLPKFTLFFIQKVSILSYGAYLWNNLFIRFMIKYFPEMNWIASILIFLSLTMLISQMTYKLIEQPFMRIRERCLNTYSKS